MTEPQQTLLKVMSLLLMAFSLWTVIRRMLTDSGEYPTHPVRRRKGRWLMIVLAVLGSRLLILALGMWIPGGDAKTLWTRWDALHYTTIMEQGYTADQSTEAWLNIVFFPLYPLVCRLLGGHFWSMLAVSWSCLAGAAVVIDRLSSRGEGFWAVLWLCVFPVTVFLGAPYTESLFLLTTALTLWMIRKGKWMLAGIFGMLAALTRNLGVLTALAFITQYLVNYRRLVRQGQARWRGLFPAILRGGGLWCALIPAGTLIYLGINRLVYGDALAFMAIQKAHWSQGFGFFGQMLVTSLNYALFYPETLYRYYLFIPQTALMIITLITLPFLLRKMNAAEAVYSLAYLFFCMSPTWLLSYPRYLMGLATLYPALAGAVRPLWARILLTAAFLAAALPMTVAYLRGWPVL